MFEQHVTSQLYTYQTEVFFFSALPIQILPLLSLQILGTPTEETWPGITKNPEFNGKYPLYHAEPLSLHAPRLDNEAIDLLGKLLHFESRNRIPAKNALRHAYFQSLGTRILSLPNSKSHQFNKGNIPPTPFSLSYPVVSQEGEDSNESILLI